MAQVPSTTHVDPALERLREVAERIRRRVADGPERPPPKARYRPPPLPPPQPHWSDGRDEAADEPSQH
jgi:hypothetical protein